MKPNKIFLFTALLRALCASVMQSPAQSTNPPPPSLSLPVSLDFLTNIPTQTNFALATLGIDVGAVSRNGTFENEIKLEYYRNTSQTNIHLFLWAAEQNAALGSPIDNLSAGAGIRKAWANADLKASLFGRRTFQSGAGSVPSWQGGLSAGGSWRPFSGNSTSIGVENRFMTPPSGFAFKSVAYEIVASVGWRF